MQKGVVSYKLLSEGWDVSDHFGDGYDLVAEKADRFIKIELKAIDINSIEKGKNATQHLSANELVNATHLIITVFDSIVLKENYIMSICQFAENSGVKKYIKYNSCNEFLDEYRKLSLAKSQQKKHTGNKKRLDFDFSFNPKKIGKWKLAKFKNHWEALETEK